MLKNALMMSSTPLAVCVCSGALMPAAALVASAMVASAAADEACEPHWDNAIGQPGTNNWVKALTELNDNSGSGPALYAGGEFTAAGGVSANRIAKWDGESWSALGTGMNWFVRTLTVFDDGSRGTDTNVSALLPKGAENT